MTAVVGYTLRACLPTKRRLGLAALCAAALLFGLLGRTTLFYDAYRSFARPAAFGLFGLVLPLAALVVGDAVLGAEVRKATFHFTWLSPTSLVTIAVGRWLAGWLMLTATIAPAFAIAALIAGAPAVAAPAALAAVAGAAAYVAVLQAIGASFRRAAIVSLAAMFIVERLLGGVLSGIAQWSPMWQAQQVFAGLARGSEDYVRDGMPHGWWAVVRLAVITAIGLGLTVWRLREIKLSGGDD